MVPQVRETREYEDDPHNSANRPAQPFGNWFFIWPRATHEGRIECACSEPEHNGHESHDSRLEFITLSVRRLISRASQFAGWALPQYGCNGQGDVGRTWLGDLVDDGARISGLCRNS